MPSTALSHDQVAILLVDDRPANLLALESVLETLGEQILTAASGAEAIRLAADHDFAAILLDVQMPSMDGFETAARLRATPRAASTPIVFITATQMDDQQIARGYALGAVDYVLKPFPPEAMRAKVAVYLDLFRRTRGLQAKLWNAMPIAAQAKVLVANDDLASLLATEAALCRASFAVLTARTGREALSSLLKHDVALILLDVHMPDMGGFEVARLLRQNSRFSSVPIVFVTASAQAEADVTQGYRLGAVDFIFTPIAAHLLRAKVEALVEQFSRHRLLAQQIREIAKLNQKWYAAVGELEALNATLEQRVQDRMADLFTANATLQREVVERQAAAAERERLQGQLVQAQKMESVGRLAGGVAHDFNNLLTGIMNYVELCRDSLGTDHPIRGYLDEITQDALRSITLTRQLLAFARKQTIAPVTLDLNDALSGMVKMLRHLLGEDINLAWLPGSALWMVRMDPSQLDQILMNLVVNARDAIGGVGRLAIETGNATVEQAYCADHADAVPGEYVMLTVSDSGCGMDRETLAHLFEPFFTTKDVGKGTGLGLATVYGIVRQNRGFINVYSEPGKGSTFKIYLPRCDAQGAPVPAALPQTERPGGTETILLVEDERSVRVTTQRFLGAMGYTVLSAADPKEALRLAAAPAGEIHLLITDVVMPGLSGHDLAQRLVGERSTLKCLFMSGYTADAIAHRGILDQGVNFLAKPFTRDDLLRKVRAVLDAQAPMPLPSPTP